MIQKVMSLLRGTVRVRVESAFPERVLNVCAARGIPLTEPRFLGEEVISLAVARRDWSQFKAACADLGAAASVEHVAGAPFLIGRLRRRRALLAGAALCLALLALSACFVWDVRVEGAERVPEERVLRVLASLGMRRGSFAFSFNQHDLCNRALLQIPELSWLTVNVRGCRATVIVRERVEKPQIVNESAPTNVVAKRDALVTAVRAFDGEARVLPGTTVRRGQLLISGVVDTRGVASPAVGERFLAGKGEVWGRTWYELSTKIPLYALQKTPCEGEWRTGAVLWGENRLKFRIKGAGNLSTKYDKIIDREQWTLPGGIPLPVTWVTETYRPYGTIRVERGRDEAEAMGRATLERRLSEQLGESGEIVSARVSSAVQGEWLLVTLSAECIEQIGDVVPIPVE